MRKATIASNAVDTEALLQGLPGRIVVANGNTFLVVKSDSDMDIHIFQWDGSTLTEFSSLGQGNPLVSGTNQGMVAAVLDGNTLHVVYLTDVAGQKTLQHLEFDTASLLWGTADTHDLDGSLEDDALALMVDTDGGLHLAVWNADTTYDLLYITRTAAGVWDSEEVEADQADAPAYLPCIDVAGSKVLILGDDGTGGVEEQDHWTVYEREGSDDWASTSIKGLGPATAVHTRGNIRHLLFAGDKRHTIIKGRVTQLTTTVGAFEFEQPYVDGGIVDGVSYLMAPAVTVVDNDLYVALAANGTLYRGVYSDGIWSTLLASESMTADQDLLIAPVAAAQLDDNQVVLAVKIDEASWHLFSLPNALPDRAGMTHDLTINGKGYMTSSVQALQKADISQAIPRVSLATELKSEEDFSDRSSITQYTFHHGRGERILEDPSAYFDADSLLLHIPNQVTPQFASYATLIEGGSLDSGFLVGPDGATVGPDGGSVGPRAVGLTGSEFQGYPIDALLYQGNFYVLIYGDSAATNALYVWNNDDEEFEAVVAGLDTTSGSPGDLEIFNEDLWIAQGDADNARYFNFSGSAWADGEVPAYCFKSWDGQLWRADNINEIYYSSDPDNTGAATWTLLGTVDDGAGTTARIRAFRPYGGALLVFTDFGTWQIIGNVTDGYLLRPLLDDESQRSPNNALAIANFGGVMFYNVGDGVTRFDGSTRTEVGPNRSPLASSKYQALPANKQGQFTSMAATDNLLYMAIDAGAAGLSTIYVYSGTGWNEFWQAAEVGQRCRWVFHTPPLTATGVMSNRLLWFEQGGEIHYMILPRNGENPLTDSSVRYRVGKQHKLITGWRHYNLPALYKVLHDLIARFENFGTEANDYNLHVYYQLEEGPDTFDTDDWTYLATFGHAPDQSINILERTHWAANPDQFSGAIGGLQYRQVRFMLAFDTEVGGSTETSTPPVLRSFGERFVVRPDRRYGFTTILQCYDEVELLNEGLDIRSAAEMRNEILGFADQKTPLFIDDGSLVPLINWILNPGFEVDSDDSGLADEWQTINDGFVTTSLSTKHKTHGNYSQKLTITGASVTTGIKQGNLHIPPGVAAHVEANIFVESGQSVQILVIDQDTQEVLGRSAPVLPRSPVFTPFRFEDTHVDIEKDDVLRTAEIWVVVEKPVASKTTVFYVDSALMYLGQETPHYYIDGDQPRCQWIGNFVRSHLAPSLRLGGYTCYITGSQEVVRNKVALQTREANVQSDITLFMREAGI